jgi:FlgD Ig-like domain
MTSKIRTFLLTVVLLLVAVQPMIVLGYDYRVWDGDHLDGKPIRQGYHIEWLRSAAQDADGNLLIVWSDTRLGDRDLYVQLVDPDGIPQWGEDGKVVVQKYSRSEDPHVMPDGNGNWIITWVDYRYAIDDEYDSAIFMKKIDSNGNDVWGGTGEVEVCMAVGEQLFVQSFTDDNGGAVAIWTDNRAQNADLYAQHVSADGATSYETDGRLVAGGPGHQGDIDGWAYTADTDGAGGIIFAWVDNLIDDNNIFINRLQSDGALTWADYTGFPLCADENDQGSVKLAPDGNGGAFVVWGDKREDTDGDIYGQHISADGTISWTANGVPIVEHESSQAGIRIVAAATGEAVLAWEDKRLDPVTEEDLFAQKISNNNGTPLLHWGPTEDPLGGMPFCLASGVQTQSRLTSDGNGGVYISWSDKRNFINTDDDLYGQHIAANGDLLWPSEDDDGIVICDEYLLQSGNIIRNLGDHTAFIWFDYRLGSPSLFIQVYDENGDELLLEDGESLVYGIDSNALRPQIINSGDGHIFMAWDDGRSGALGTQIYVQKMDINSGETIFPENGISILPGFPYGESDTVDVSITESQIRLVSDGQNGLFAAWIDQRFDDLHTFVQHMDSEGNVLWGERGIVVANGPLDDFQQDDIQIVPLDDNGLLAVYRQSEVNFSMLIRAQRFDENGNGLWSSEDGTGIPLHTIFDDYEIEAIEKFDNESVLVVYQRYGAGGLDLFAQRINLDGTLDWETELTLCSAADVQFNVVAKNVAGGIVVAWEDKREGGAQTDIFGQLINDDGTVEWDVNGKSLNSENNEQKEMSLSAISDESDNFWLAWQDFRDGTSRDIYVQRYDLDGETMLAPATGIALGSDLHGQTNPSTLVVEGDSLWVVWEDIGTTSNKDLHYALVGPNGDVGEEFADGGLVLSSAYHNQGIVQLVSDDENGFMSVWEDDRSTGKETISNVYAQRVNPIYGDVATTGDNIPSGWELSDAYPNPFNPSTKIGYKVAKASNVKITVYDILGREVANILNTVKSAGNHVVYWNGMNSSNALVASGVYFYQLTSENVTITKRMVLMK